MTDHHFDLMPDHLAALELELRARAAPVSRKPERRASIVLRPALGAVFALFLLVAVLASAGSLGGGTRAYGRPPILNTPSLPIARDLAPMYVGTPRQNLGTWQLTEARPIHARDGAYLLTGSGAWCLAIAAPGANPETDDFSMTCMPSSEFYRFGMSLRIGSRYLAIALPDAPLPTFTRNGTTVTLQPDAQGVVTVPDFHSGDTITMYSPDGKARPDHAS